MLRKADNQLYFAKDWDTFLSSEIDIDALWKPSCSPFRDEAQKFATEASSLDVL